jgi:hypothetical protein
MNRTGQVPEPDPVADAIRRLDTHCQGGGRASVDAFVMERLGHPTRN